MDSDSTRDDNEAKSTLESLTFQLNKNKVGEENCESWNPQLGAVNY